MEVGPLSVPADLLIFLAILAVLWIAYRVVKYRRERRRPSLGDANAYDGNLLPPGGDYRPSGGQKSHGGKHVAHGGGHKAHGGVHGGHTAHGGGHSGHSGAGGGHH
jgi:hypothetical protein